MQSGQVKFYNSEKAYGFLTSDDGQEIFVHVTGCEEEIKKGDRVTFDVTEGKKGLNAIKVRVERN